MRWALHATVSACLWVLTPAAVPRGIPIVARLALGAVGSRRVVEAAQAATRAPVACLWVRHVDVIMALAGQAASAGLQRVPVVSRRTLVTAGTCRHRALGSAQGRGTPKGTERAATSTHLCTQDCTGRQPAGSGCPGSRRRRSAGGCRAPRGRGRAGSAARSPALGSQSVRPHTCRLEVSRGQGCRQHPAPVQAHTALTSGTSRHPCGRGSASSCPSRGHSLQCAHCTGNAGRWGSPSSRAGSGRSVRHGHPHGRSTAPWHCRRLCSPTPRCCTGTLEGTAPPVSVPELQRAPLPGAPSPGVLGLLSRLGWHSLAALTSASAGPKAEGSRGAAVAAPSHDVGFALALPTLGPALGAERALGVTEAGCGQRGGEHRLLQGAGQGAVWGVELYSRSAPSCRMAERLCRRLEQGSATGEGPAAWKGWAQRYRSKVCRRSMELGSPAMNISSEE